MNYGTEGSRRQRVCVLLRAAAALQLTAVAAAAATAAAPFDVIDSVQL